METLECDIFAQKAGRRKWSDKGDRFIIKIYIFLYTIRTLKIPRELAVYFIKFSYIDLNLPK